ncbi:MAG: class I SAM-dependent methyltransferase [Thermoleophilaceae bacterium]
MGIGRTRPRIEYLFWPKVWDTYRETVERYASRPDVVSVCDVGGGANPTLDLPTVERHGLDYTVVDVSEDELAKTPPGYRTVCGDIISPGLLGNEQFDLVCSSQVAEHVADAAAFHSAVLRMLRPGGHTIHMFPALGTLPFALNRLLPERLTDRILSLFQEGRDREGSHAKFPAYYRWCLGPVNRQIERLEQLGYVVNEYIGFFGHGYYRRIRPLDRLEQEKSYRLLKRPIPALSSYAVIVLERPTDAAP